MTKEQMKFASDIRARIEEALAQRREDTQAAASGLRSKQDDLPRNLL